MPTQMNLDDDSDHDNADRQRLTEFGRLLTPASVVDNHRNNSPEDGQQSDGQRSDGHQCEDMLFTSSPCNHKYMKPCKSINAQRPSLLSHHKPSLAVDGDLDRVDALPKDMSFTWLDAAAILFSIGSFLFDIGTDMVVAAFHYISQDYWYFGLTLTFVLIPTLIMTGISMRWYVLDAREEGSPPISSFQWVMRFVFLMLQLGPILRYFDSLMYGLKFRQHKNKQEQEKYFQYMIYEDTDATMLRLFECFMEAAPQLVLQMYILAKGTPHDANDHWTVVAQIAAVITSLVSLSWSLVSYQRSLRMSLPDKANMTWLGIAIHFIWRLFVIGARVLALALFASEYRFYISIVCVVHWLLMFAWIITMRTSFCDNRYEELGYNSVLAVMFIFCYFNPVDSPTRYRYTAYYTFMLAENTMLMCMWYYKCSPEKWYRYPAMFGHFISFFVGLVFMAIYYMTLHPSGNIRVWRTRQDYDETSLQNHVVRNGYKREIRSGLWTTQGRLLHPRPAIPTMPNNDGKTEKRSRVNARYTPEGSAQKGTIV